MQRVDEWDLRIFEFRADDGEEQQHQLHSDAARRSPTKSQEGIYSRRECCCANLLHSSRILSAVPADELRPSCSSISASHSMNFQSKTVSRMIVTDSLRFSGRKNVLGGRTSPACGEQQQAKPSKSFQETKMNLCQRRHLGVSIRWQCLGEREYEMKLVEDSLLRLNYDSQ